MRARRVSGSHRFQGLWAVRPTSSPLSLPASPAGLLKAPRLSQPKPPPPPRPSRLMSRGTTVSLSPIEHRCPQEHGTSIAKNSNQCIVHTAHVLSLHGHPPCAPLRAHFPSTEKQQITSFWGIRLLLKETPGWGGGVSRGQKKGLCI